MGSGKSTQASSSQPTATVEENDFVQEQMQTQVCGPPGGQRGSRRLTSSGPRKLFTADQNLKDKLVAVIITISEGSSYDDMFSTVKPTTVAGERVSTYAVGCRDMAKMHQLLSSASPMPESAEAWRCLVEDVQAVPADSVVFNWECCDACGNHAFPSSGQTAGASGSETLLFMGFAVRSGWTVMCSDFSLKSLIFDWSEEQLGPNPFLELGGCSGQVMLEFAPAELANEEVPQQLQVVGELCGDKGKAVIEAMGDTIVYSVNPTRIKTDKYDLKVLTVVTDGVHVAENMKCAVGEGNNRRSGAAGHVTLTYKEGGQIVASNGHWIELTRVDVSLEAIERAAARNFGGEELRSFQAEWACAATDQARTDVMQSRAKKLVQQSAPSRMKARTKY